MAKTANIYARIDGDTKTQAEKILKEQGISVSKAINLLYLKIIAYQGLPFLVKLPEEVSQNLIAEEDAQYTVNSKKENNINVRIEPEFKNKVDIISKKLGLTTSVIINLFYNQIILMNNLPFSEKDPSPLIDHLSPEELNYKILHSYADGLNDDAISITELKNSWEGKLKE